MKARITAVERSGEWVVVTATVQEAEGPVEYQVRLDATRLARLSGEDRRAYVADMLRFERDRQRRLGRLELDGLLGEIELVPAHRAAVDAWPNRGGGRQSAVGGD